MLSGVVSVGSGNFRRSLGGGCFCSVLLVPPDRKHFQLGADRCAVAMQRSLELQGLDLFEPLDGDVARHLAPLLALVQVALRAGVRTRTEDEAEQVVVGDAPQQFQVMSSHARGFLSILNVFSQVRKYRPNTFLLQSLRGRQGIAQIFSRHESRDRASHEFVFRRVIAQPGVL